MVVLKKKECFRLASALIVIILTTFMLLKRYKNKQSYDITKIYSVSLLKIRKLYEIILIVI